MSVSEHQNEWLTAGDIAKALGVTARAVSCADQKGSKVAGQRVESRSVTDEDRDRLALHGHTRRLYRIIIVPPEPGHDIDDLLADLAGCEALIEELEAKLARMTKAERDAAYALENATQALAAEASLRWAAECDRDEHKELSDLAEVRMSELEAVLDAVEDCLGVVYYEEGERESGIVDAVREMAQELRRSQTCVLETRARNAALEAVHANCTHNKQGRAGLLRRVARRVMARVE